MPLFHLPWNIFVLVRPIHTIHAIYILTIHLGLQIQNLRTENPYSGPVALTRDIYKHHGIRGIYRGLRVTMAREFFGYGIYFMTYEWMVRREISRRGLSGRSDVEPWRIAVYGAIASYFLWLNIMPIVYVYCHHG